MNKVLLSVTSFKMLFHKTKKYKGVFDSLSEMGVTKADNELWAMVDNTAKALKAGAAGLSIPKTPKSYTGNKVSYVKMARLLDKMVEEEYLEFLRGGVTKWGQDKEVVQSVYLFRESLLRLWIDIDVSSEDCKADTPIVIRDRETKECLSTRGRKGISKMSEDVNDYNEVLLENSFSFDDEPIPSPQYQRIFLDSLNAGGRFYAIGGSVQTLSQEDRKKLKINGEKLVELDFKALHPAILFSDMYRMYPEKVERYAGVDPYDVDDRLGFMFKIDEEALAHYRKTYNANYRPIRNLAKMALLIALNANSMVAAASAVLTKWRDDTKKPEAEQKFHGLVYETSKGGIAKFSSVDFIMALGDYLPPLRNLMCADLGVVLQYRDSQIMSRILSAMTERGEAVLSEHDSVLCPERLLGEVEQLMREAFVAECGTDKFCKIELK